MANNKVMMMVIAAVAMVLLVFAPHAAAAITCQRVVKGLLPCRNYLTKGGAVPAVCCNGVRSLNSAANTPAARKTACGCIKAAAKAYKVNAQYAAALPNLCKVNLGYPISFSTNCNNVR